MKVKSLFAWPVCLFSLLGWHYNIEEAKEIARKEHKHILLIFSGSDWCGPCILMHKEIFESPVFLQMADTELVLVQADFPRLKKNKLSATQETLNNAAADRYNSQGKFPYTVLLNDNGKLLRVWDGYPNTTPEEFIRDIRNGIFADREKTH